MVRQRGASYGADQKWIIRGGFAFDPTPIPNQFRTARLPDAKRYWLALGIGYKSSVDLRFGAANVHIFG
jgi:long-chain fatty acid transport protein